MRSCISTGGVLVAGHTLRPYRAIKAAQTKSSMPQGISTATNPAANQFFIIL
jgi:hypothetical protein